MFRHLPRFIFVLAVFFSVYGITYAVSSIAVSFDVLGENVLEGHIISFKDEQYSLSSVGYEEALFGVVDDDAPVSLEDANLEEFRLITSIGEADVLVNGENGDIQKGDYITSSSVAGEGMKAVRSGFVIGIAMNSASFSSPEDSHLVYTYVRPDAIFISDFRSNLLETIKGGFSSPLLDPVVSLRYILAIIITGTSFALGFATFSRISKNSVEAIGRNPLAGASIRRVVVLNFLMSFAILATGLGISYLILAL